MLPAERKQKILDLLLGNGKAGVAELAETFGVTRETVRRDLEKLEAEGKLERTHGGAVAIVERSRDLPYLTRESFNHAAKQQIAYKAAQLIGDGDAVMLDSSSTVFEILGFLKQHRDLQLISNSLRLAVESTNSEHSLITVGGDLRKKSLAFVGGLAEELLSRFHADWALIGCGALHAEAGVLESNPSEAQFKRVMISHAKRIALLVDHSKFDCSSLVQICTLDRIDVIVTDRRPNATWIERLAAFGIRLVY
ncbi:DeoR/GlpR family DNA-binding transcription regulator [Kushneria sp. AK178]